MKTIRKEWPRVRQYVKAGNTYFSVDLRRKHYRGQKWKNFNSRDKALDYASKIGSKVAKSGIESIQTLQETNRIKAWAERCAIYTLSDLNRNGVRLKSECCPTEIGISVRQRPEYARWLVPILATVSAAWRVGLFSSRSIESDLSQFIKSFR